MTLLIYKFLFHFPLLQKVTITGNFIINKLLNSKLRVKMFSSLLGKSISQMNYSPSRVTHSSVHRIHDKKILSYKRKFMYTRIIRELWFSFCLFSMIFFVLTRNYIYIQEILSSQICSCLSVNVHVKIKSLFFAESN